jgi:hypothetical protein
MAAPSVSATEIRVSLEAIFRERIAIFYRALQVTPPYHSVEKAILALREVMSALELPALQRLSVDEASLGALFTQIVSDSGLAQKHRGIIRGLLRNGQIELPQECRSFANAYRS